MMYLFNSRFLDRNSRLLDIQNISSFRKLHY